VVSVSPSVRKPLKKGGRVHRVDAEYAEVFLVFQYVAFAYSASSLRSPRPSLLFLDGHWIIENLLKIVICEQFLCRLLGQDVTQDQVRLIWICLQHLIQQAIMELLIKYQTGILAGVFHLCHQIPTLRV